MSTLMRFKRWRLLVPWEACPSCLEPERCQRPAHAVASHPEYVRSRGHPKLRVEVAS
jgi:hypothetical protein